MQINKQQLIDDFMSRRYLDYYSWGMEEVDKIGGLLTFGRMAIIGGPHGSGKTTFITELAKTNAQTKPTMLIPLEMGEEYTIMMLVCNRFNNRRKFGMEMLSYGDVEEGYLYQRSEEEIELFKSCVNEVYENKGQLTIGVPDTNTIGDLIAYITLHAAKGVRLFVIDHLHQLDTTIMMPIEEGVENRVGIANETGFYSQVAKELKDLAQRLHIALLCVVQLTKSANGIKGDMDLSAFKGTSEFTSNAHRVVLIKKVGEPKKKSNIEEQMTQMIAFEKETKNIRELLFLKTRGRIGGPLYVEMVKGEFEFGKEGYYNFTPKA